MIFDLKAILFFILSCILFTKCTQPRNCASSFRRDQTGEKENVSCILAQNREFDFDKSCPEDEAVRKYYVHCYKPVVKRFDSNTSDTYVQFEACNAELECRPYNLGDDCFVDLYTYVKSEKGKPGDPKADGYHDVTYAYATRADLFEVPLTQKLYNIKDLKADKDLRNLLNVSSGYSLPYGTLSDIPKEKYEKIGYTAEDALKKHPM